MASESVVRALPGVREMVAKPRYVEPRWCEDGMEVIAPFRLPEDPRVNGVICRVACAAGNHARVVNEKRGIDRWYPLYDLRVLEGDPHA